MTNYVSALRAQMKMSLQVRRFCKDFRDEERLGLDPKRWIVVDRVVGILGRGDNLCICLREEKTIF